MMWSIVIVVAHVSIALFVLLGLLRLLLQLRTLFVQQAGVVLARGFEELVVHAFHVRCDVLELGFIVGDLGGCRCGCCGWCRGLGIELVVVILCLGLFIMSLSQLLLKILQFVDLIQDLLLLVVHLLLGALHLCLGQLEGVLGTLHAGGLRLGRVALGLEVLLPCFLDVNDLLQVRFLIVGVVRFQLRLSH